MAVGLSIRTPISQPLAHVMQQEICVRVDRLRGELWVLYIVAGDMFGDMTARAAELLKELLSSLHLRALPISARWRGQRLGVEGDIG